MPHQRNLLLCSLLLGFSIAPVCSVVLADSPLRIEVAKEPVGWKIFQGKKLVLGYQFDSNGKPIVYPVIGPSGHPMTRDFPMTKAGVNERSDHDHHRSMWLTHGNVNGIDFWLDDRGCGKILHQGGAAKANPDGSVTITTENDWNGPDGTHILSDSRKLTVTHKQGRRILDWDVVLIASQGDVNFGDTKEGSFGIRVAGTMKVDAKKGGVTTNAEGKTNKDAWGKKSAWVDYSGPVGEDVVGITVHNHPQSFGYPCRWHVRTYGLFAANPFGVHHFTGGPKTSGIVLKQGETMRLSYRVILHDGSLDVNQAAEDDKQYASTPRYQD